MNKLATCLPLLGALFLTACGGGGNGLTTAGIVQTSGNGIAVGEPAPGAPASDDFVKMARAAACADQANRLYVIDGKQVFWHRAGRCADNAYGNTLFGLTPQNVQCQGGDSIVGPRSSCTDEGQRAAFDTMTRNLDKADLGLGAGRKVERLSLLPKDGDVAHEKLAHEQYTGVNGASSQVLRDAGSFQKLWDAVHQIRSPAPAAPAIDFTRKMVIAVAAGSQPNGCYGLTIERLVASGDTLLVGYSISTPHEAAICTQAIVSPIAMVVVDRREGKVEFVAN